MSTSGSGSGLWKISGRMPGVCTVTCTVDAAGAGAAAGAAAGVPPPRGEDARDREGNGMRGEDRREGRRSVLGGEANGSAPEDDRRMPSSDRGESIAGADACACGTSRKGSSSSCVSIWSIA